MKGFNGPAVYDIRIKVITKDNEIAVDYEMEWIGDIDQLKLAEKRLKNRYYRCYGGEENIAEITFSYNPV